MAEEPAAPGTAVAVQRPPPRQAITVESAIPIFDTARFEHYGRIAAIMANASLVPDSLRADGRDAAVANCFMVVNQADRWGMDPFAVAQCCSVVHGRLMYEGKLVSAVIKAKLKLDLHYHFTGEKGSPDYRVYVSDKEFTDAIIEKLKPGGSYKGWRIIDGSVAEWHTTKKNSQEMADAWKKQPDMQLRYRGARVWCRAYESALMLGVYTEDEMEELREERAPLEPRRLTAGFGDETDRSFRQPAAETQGAPPAAGNGGGSNPPADAGAGAGAPQGGDGGGNSVEEVEHDADGVVIDGQRTPPEEEKGAAEAEREEAARGQGESQGEADTTSKSPPSSEGSPAPEVPAVSGAFAVAADKIKNAPHFAAGKQAMRTLQATDDFKAAPEDEATRMRAMLWARYEVLVEEGKEKAPVSSDPYLFRLWMNFGAKSEAEIDGLFPALMRTPDYQKMTDGQKNEFGKEMTRVKAALADG